MSSDAYVVRRTSRSRFVTLRGLRHHVLEWGDASMTTPERPTLLMQHGWMDVAASFQFVVDALPTDRHVLAFDWRGFGLTDATRADTYWLPDYVADLDAAIDALCLDRGAPRRQIDLLGHSMGGNVVMLYAGLRPERIRRLVNLEGFGMPATRPAQAPKRFVQWLDELKTPAELRDYDPEARVMSGREAQLSARLEDQIATLDGRLTQLGDRSGEAQLVDLWRQRVARAQLAEQPLERPRARRILGDAGAPPVVVGARVEHRAQKGIVVLVVRAGEHADEVRLVVIGLPHLESEAIAGGGVLDREQRVPGEDELEWSVHTRSA